MARRTVDSKMLSLYLDWFYMCMHYMCMHYMCMHYMCMHYMCMHDMCMHYMCMHYMCMHYMCIALARAPTWQSGRSASVQAGRIDRTHRRVAWVRAVRWRCRPGLAVNMDQIGMYFNKVLISIVSLSGILT